MQPMQIITRDDTDPYFNIATEEFLLKNAVSDTFSVYRNDPCVVIGKHQNHAREINHGFVAGNGIPVIRRITGGGTVYHDPGCLNFCFIWLGRKTNPINFRAFTQPIIKFLESLGLEAVFKDKSNIEVEFALRDINKPMGVSELKLVENLPDNLKASLPTIEEIEVEFDKIKK